MTVNELSNYLFQIKGVNKVDKSRMPDSDIRLIDNYYLKNVSI